VVVSTAHHSTIAPTAKHRSVTAAPAPAGLSVKQLAGQRIIYSYAGLTPPTSLVNRIRRGEAAGVIFFAPNIASRGQLHAVATRLDLANRSSPVQAPLLLMTDQEGGLVRRLPGAPEDSEKQIGESTTAVALAREAGRGAAANLSAAGLNVNLAPVLDVFRHSGNFIDSYERSYSDNPARVATLGEAFIRAQQAAGVVATAKHFPGLGAAERNQDTDEGPAVIDQPLPAIRAIDEAPYRAAIASRVGLVMLSWGTYPALDSALPAGLSPTIVKGELRRRLGFRGVTVTDSLEAGALQAFGGPAQRALLAVRAGDDLILCSGRNVSQDSPTIGAAALAGIASGIAAHELGRPAAERAAEETIQLRRRL
jgi:beta-N-acetylhexosaminidase